MTTVLFWLQVVMACVYTAPQLYFIFTGHTKGLTLAMYVIFIAYLIFSLSLSITSYRLNPNVIRKRTIVIFAQWVVFIGLIMILGFEKIVWQTSDSVICLIVLALAFITVIKYHGFKDPFSKALLAVWCKAIPQLWLAYAIVCAGSSDGLPLVTLVAGHLTAVPRLIQIGAAGMAGGWDRPTKGLFLGEFSNVATWVVVTAAWLIFR